MYDKKLFKEAFSVLTASEDTLTEVLNMTTKKKRGYKALRFIPIAAIIIVLLSLTALAAVGFTRYENPVAMIQAFFGENGESNRDGIVEYDDEGRLTTNQPGWERIPVDESLADTLITPYISAQDATITWDEYTLSVEANCYDPVMGVGILYYTLENPNGITGIEVFSNGELWFNPDTVSFTIQNRWASASYIDEAMSTDTKMYICDYYIKVDGWGQLLQLSVWSYEEEKSKGSADILLADIGSMNTLSLSDGNVLVSPIGICIYGEALGFDRSSNLHKIILRYEDGTEYALVDGDAFIDNSAYALVQGFSSSTFTTYAFNRIVDIDQLSEIVLDNLTIHVN